MTYSVQQICDFCPDLVVDSTDVDRKFSQMSAVDDYHADSLIFVSEASQAAELGNSLPSVIVTDARIAPSIPNGDTAVITVTNVRLAQAIIKSQFNDYDPSDSEWPDIHPSAVIHADAKLGKNVRVGPCSVIGKNAVIGDNTIIRANCVIEHDAQVGESCTIHNLVNIGLACIIGDRVIIRPGAIVGNEGFGFAQDENKHYHRVPHTGIVEVQDDVQIGSNCNIDRATYGKTVISRGVKIDSLCHIAHNCFVDEDALFVSQSGIAGSCHIGKRVISSGQTGMLDHRSVADDALLVHRCGVTEDIPSAGMWAGTPPRPFKEYVRNLDSGKKMKKLEERINKKLDAIEKKLDLKS